MFSLDLQKLLLELLLSLTDLQLAGQHRWIFQTSGRQCYVALLPPFEDFGPKFCFLLQH